jgi:hypothetical protein
MVNLIFADLNDDAAARRHAWDPFALLGRDPTTLDDDAVANVRGLYRACVADEFEARLIIGIDRDARRAFGHRVGVKRSQAVMPAFLAATTATPTLAKQVLSWAATANDEDGSVWKAAALSDSTLRHLATDALAHTH